MAKIPGTAVASPIVPLDSGLPTPTHVDTYGKGGWVTVASLAERNAIPPERRKPGMVAAVADAPGSTPWELATDLVTWMPFRPPSFPNAEIFTNTSLAVAGTTAGDWFYVADETGKSLYRNVAGVATFVILEASAAQLTAATEAAATNAALAVAAKEAAEEAADRVDLGALDAAVAATEADALQTAQDRAQTTADRGQVAADLAQTNADRVQTGLDVVAAETARDAAFVNADIYADTADGLSATVEGEQFQVVGAGGLEIIRYRHDAGPVAAEVSRYPSALAVERRRETGLINGWPDPFFRHFSLANTEQLGRERYFFGTIGAPTLTLVPNTVYDGQALRKTGNTDLSGPRIWLDDIGVAEGDTLTVRGLVVGNGELVDWIGRWLDISGVVIGTQIGSAFTASAEPSLATMSGVAPAGAVSFRMYPTTASGGDGTFDIAAVWAYRGNSNDGPTVPAFDDSAYLALVDAAQQDQINAPRETGVINGWPDPFFRHFSLANTEQLGRERYFFGTTGAPTLTLVPNTVYNGQALRKTGNTDLSGPRIWLDDIGVAEGDTLTVRGLVVGNGELVDWIGRWLDISGVVIGTQIGSAFTASAEPSLATMSGVAPAGAVSFRMYPTTASGGDGTFDIAAVWAYRGEPDVGPESPAFDDGAYLSLIDADQQQQLDALGGPELPRENSAAWGNWNLRSYRAQRAKISGGAGELIVAVIGDSWVAASDLVYQPIRDYFNELIGVSAPGYVSAVTALPASSGATRVRTGTWTDVRVEPNVFGPDTAHATTTDLAATISFSAAAVSRYIIHYVNVPDGGTFSYAIGGGAPTNVETNAAVAHQTIEIAGAANQQLNIAIVSAGVAGVTITGVDIRNDTPGQAVVHKLGNGGATALRFESVPAGNLTAAYSALAPHLAIILLGTNDNSQNVTLEAFKTRIKNVADRIIAGSPRCDILLVGPGPNDLVRTFEIDNYNDQLFALARENGWAFIDLKRFFGEFADADARGLYADGAHPNADGGRVIGAAIVSEHLGV